MNNRIKELRGKVKELHVFLKENCEDINEAKETLRFTSSAINGSFEDLRLKTKISKLQLEPQTGQEKWDKLYDIIKDLSVTDADIVISGMIPAIESEFNKTFGTHKMDELNIEILE